MIAAALLLSLPVFAGSSSAGAPGGTGTSAPATAQATPGQQAKAVPAQAVQVAPKVTLDVPGLYLEGESFVVSVAVQASSEKSLELPAWAITGAAFTLGNKNLGKRSATDKVTLQPSQSFSTSVDLAPLIQELAPEARDFQIGWNALDDVPRHEVLWLEGAEKGIEFMDLPLEQLTDYQVALQTNRGVIWLELWPDAAPNHVRNFLDLAYTGFYDRTQFYRVIPGFMIQGGKAREGESAPRKLKAEFSTKRHERGVLSMARLPNDVDSGTSEFFIMHATRAQLDGKYSVFGKMLLGEEALDAIAISGDTRFDPKTTKGSTPTTPQVIERAVVVKSHKQKR